MASDTRQVRLADCCDINPASITTSWPHRQIRYIDISSVGEGTQSETFKLLSRAEAPSRAQRLVEDGDTILSTVRPGRRSILWLGSAEPNMVASTGFAVLRANRKVVDPRYLYYTVFNPAFTDYLVMHEQGAAYPAVSREDIGAAQITLPPLAVQKRIADILGALDDKIELNRKMNETLEQLASTLFRSWFVDFDPVHAKAAGRQPAGMDKATADLFPDSLVDSELGKIPSGWEAGALSSLSEFSRESINPGESPSEIFDHYSLPSFDEGKAPKAEAGCEIKSNKLVVTKTCVLLSKLNPHIPRIWLPNLNASRRSICSTEFIVASAMAGCTREYLYALFISEDFSRTYGTLVTGTTGSHQRIRAESVLQMRLPIAPTKLISSFTDTITPILNQVASNTKESQTLAELRDTLLPQLLNGDLKVA